MSCIGATETVEGGDKLPAGLCPLVVFCQSAWRRAGEMLENQIHWEKLSVYYTKFNKGYCLNIIFLFSFRGEDQQKMSSQ